MKIAIIVPSLDNKGPVIVANDLCKYFVDKGYYCHVFYFDENNSLDFPCEKTKINFFSKIDFSKFDIIHSHCLKPNLYLWFHLKYRSRQAGLISTLHQPLTFEALQLGKYRLLALPLHLLDRLSHTVFDKNVFLSQEQLNLSKRNVSKDSISIIGNGRSIIKNDIKNDKDKIKIDCLRNRYKIVGTVSVIIKRKGIEQLIKALVSLEEWAAVIVGDGVELSCLKSLAEDLGVSDRCFWTGYRSDGANYIQYFDVYTLTTRSEGFPLAFIEAAAYSCPIVLSDIPILRSISNDEISLFYKLDNIDDLVSQVENAYSKRDFLSNKISLYYNENLTADKMALKYIELYKSL